MVLGVRAGVAMLGTQLVPASKPSGELTIPLYEGLIGRREVGAISVRPRACNSWRKQTIRIPSSTASPRTAWLRRHRSEKNRFPALSEPDVKLEGVNWGLVGRVSQYDRTQRIPFPPLRGKGPPSLLVSRRMLARSCWRVVGFMFRRRGP